MLSLSYSEGSLFVRCTCVFCRIADLSHVMEQLQRSENNVDDVNKSDYMD